MQLMLALLAACGDNASPTCTDVFYADSDGDGFGNVGVTTTACSIPSGFVATADDCDDRNASVHPGATEVCDDIDNDCDGSVDDDAVDAPTWYADADSDGFGDDVATTQQCAQPSGSAAVGGDCDETNGAVNPGAEEVCDGIDNDCDGSVDVGAVDAPTWYADIDGDGFGDDLAIDRTCGAQPSGTADVSGDCDDSDPAVNPSGVEICGDGKDNDCDGRSCIIESLSGAAGAKLLAEAAADGAGHDVSGAGDVDGDGNDDLLVGAWANDEGLYNAGAAYLVLGPTTGTLDLSAADAKFVGEHVQDCAGERVSGAGDTDGDGHADILVGASASGNGPGVAYLVRGPVTGTLDLSSADGTVTDNAGEIVAWDVSDAGDVNGDGRGDLLIGAFYYGWGIDPGAAYVLLGPVSGTFDLESADAKLVGEAADDAAGTSVSSAGDVDGDGNGDIVVGAYWNDEGATDAGAAYLMLGPVTETDLSVADAKLVGEAAHDWAGNDVSGAGDVDGDGHDDLIVGARYEGVADRGAAYVVLGPVTGTLDLSLADAKLSGHSDEDEAGGYVSGAGDLDDDGHDDLLVEMSNTLTLTGLVATYVVRGPVTGTLDLFGADARLDGGGSGGPDAVSDAGDLDDDGYGDFLVGATYDDDAGAFAGAAYVVYGGDLFAAGS
jgi:hypothetical protein